MPSPSGATTKYGLAYLLEIDVPDVATASEDLAAGIDAIMATAYQGTAASRPLAGTPGRIFYETDTSILAYDNGVAWVEFTLTDNVCGRIYASSGTSIPGSGAATQVINMTTDYLKGGMTLLSNGLRVPVGGDGVYTVSGSVTLPAGVTAGNCAAQIYVQGSLAREWLLDAGAGGFPSPGGSDGIKLSGGNVVQLLVLQNTGSAFTTISGTTSTWLSLALQSR